MAKYTYRPDPHFVPNPNLSANEPCPVCFDPLVCPHDHKSDKSGLDDGPYLDEYPFKQRKKAEPKDAETIREIRARAWATRRAKYGQSGHR